MDKPSKADPSFAPGSRSRYDDFVAVHINQTLTIHGTVSELDLIHGAAPANQRPSYAG